MNKLKIKFTSIGLVLGVALTLGITVYASGLISGLNVDYDNTETGLTSTNVNGAINELYTMMDTHCPSGYKCKKIEACDYEIGYSWNFSYTGGIQDFTVPCEGIYKLEVWGAQGGSAGRFSGGLGGYSIGYKEITKSSKIYIVVGGAGGNGRDCSTASGGYNGGASSSSYSNVNNGCDVRGAGGGATHMAFVTGILKDIGYSEFVTNARGLLVAAGGGGGVSDTADNSWGSNGGAGGGYIGTTGNGTFGQGTSNHAAGGGGLYGGTASSGSSAGGVGYVGGVPEIVYEGTVYAPQTQAGVNSGNGKAKVTLIAR